MSAAVVNGLVTTGAVANVLLFLSQAPMVAMMVREKDSTLYPWLPSLTLMSTLSLWSGYTVNTYSARDRPDLYAGNLSGVAIPFVFLALFAWYAKTAAARARIVGATLGCLAVTWAFSEALFLTKTPNATNISGAVTCAVNATFFYAPLRAIFDAARELDARRIPTLLTLVQLGQSLPWIAAGALLPDYFILGVNAAGECAALAQLAGLAYIALRRQQLGLKPGEDAPWVRAAKEKAATAAGVAGAAPSAVGAVEGEGTTEGAGEGAERRPAAGAV